MSNNPEDRKEVYDKAIDYMNKAQKVRVTFFFHYSIRRHVTCVIS